MSSQALRSGFSGANRGNPSDLLAAFTTHPLERAAEASKTRQLRSEHKQLVEELAEARKRLGAHERYGLLPLRPVKRLELGSGLREATAVAMLSDCHVEEMVRPGSTPVSNCYNLQIADHRMARFFSGVEWLVQNARESWKVRSLQLWYGGDMMTGAIHDENIETAQLGCIETIHWLQPRLVAGARQLVEKLQLTSLQLVMSYGNHGRNTPKPRRATGAAHSYEWGMYQRIAAELVGDKRIECLATPTGHQYTEVYDRVLHWHHGDETNYGGGVGGITIPLNKATAQWDKARRADFHHFGHWHQYMSLNNMTVNGSLIGYNPYAMSIKATPEDPQQAFYLLDSKRGRTMACPIWVRDEAHEKRVIRSGAFEVRGA